MIKKIAITKEKIIEYIGSLSSVPFYIYNIATSTNDIAKQLAANGEEQAVVIAHHQTSGRGRRGRSFFSPDGCGIYMSILLRAKENAESISLITSASAVAVCEAIQTVCGVNAGIKWINDVYVDGKKTCGILCESVFGNSTSIPEYTVIGIGINIIAPNGFPEEISDIATSIYKNDMPEEDIPARLCAAIVSSVIGYASDLSKKTFLERYKGNMMMLGKKITVHSAQESYPAVATDIDEECHLIVTLEDGSKRILSSGEISTKIK